MKIVVVRKGIDLWVAASPRFPFAHGSGANPTEAVGSLFVNFGKQLFGVEVFNEFGESEFQRRTIAIDSPASTPSAPPGPTDVQRHSQR